MSIGIIPRSFGTHSGSFHADEVTACALLLYFGYIDREKIVRTRELDALQTCDFVCDVGGTYDPEIRRFDHHQVEYSGSLSSAGMILQYLKEQKTLTEEFYQYLYRFVVKGIDDVDNGLWEPILGLCTFSAVISTYVPASYEASDSELEEGFYEALDFVLGFLDRLEKKFSYLQQCKTYVSEVMEKMHECLIFEKAIPWLEPFFELGGEDHPAEFIIMPTGKHWKLRGIPPNYEKRMQVRRPLPLEWAGLLGKELQKASGIAGAVFCHKGRFISVWETKEDALRALKHILQEENV